MTLRELLSPNPRLTQAEYDIAIAMGRKRYAVRGGLRMARWLLVLTVVILGARGYTTGNWAPILTLRVAAEVAALVVVCSTFVGYITYALVWRALAQMYGPRPPAAA
jgi:hypothetical protein